MKPGIPKHVSQTYTHDTHHYAKGLSDGSSILRLLLCFAVQLHRRWKCLLARGLAFSRLPGCCCLSLDWLRALGLGLHGQKHCSPSSTCLNRSVLLRTQQLTRHDLRNVGRRLQQGTTAVQRHRPCLAQPAPAPALPALPQQPAVWRGLWWWLVE